jgi:hypothetical protein
MYLGWDVSGERSESARARAHAHTQNSDIGQAFMLAQKDHL